MKRTDDQLFTRAREAAAGRVAEVVRTLFPEGRQRGDEWVAANHVRGDRHPGSFSVNLSTGVWNDFASGEGGDLIALVAYTLGLKPADAARWLLNESAHHAPAARPAPPPRMKPADTGPSPAEVARVWSEAGRVWPNDTRGVGAWLEARGLDAVALLGLDLVRTIPRWSWGADGAAKRRAVMRVFDAEGRLVTLVGRLVEDAAEAPKEVTPAGSPRGGRVLADAGGVRMLRGESKPCGVVICEGGPDFLSVARLWGPDEQRARSEYESAVLGIWSGSITPELLARIPDGADVVLCPHRDASGARYMQTACAGLLGRCRVAAAPYDENRDFNDTLRAGGASRLWRRIQAAEVVT